MLPLVLIKLGFETLFRLSLMLCLFPQRAQLPLEPLFRPHNLALQVETAALARFVGVKQALVPLHNLLGVSLSACRGLDVENTAGLIESHARGERGAAAGGIAELGLGALVLGGGLRLLVSSDERAAEDAGACEEGCDDEFVRL